MAVDKQILGHFLAELGDSLKKAEKTEAVYEQVVAAHQARYGDSTEADVKAASHPALTQAVSDGAYYHRRATVYGIAALVEMLRGGLE